MLRCFHFLFFLIGALSADSSTQKGVPGFPLVNESSPARNSETCAFDNVRCGGPDTCCELIDPRAVCCSATRSSCPGGTACCPGVQICCPTGSTCCGRTGICCSAGYLCNADGYTCSPPYVSPSTTVPSPPSLTGKANARIATTAGFCFALLLALFC